VFNDSGWKSGAAELGFGDGDEATTLNKNGTNGQHTTTFYFRHYFVVDDPSELVSLTVNLRRDDGAIVYVNGVEIFRCICHLERI
jgi:hypothetical protein